MNQQEINNFTRMADALEEEIFRLRKELEEVKTKEAKSMEHRMADKIKIKELENNLSTSEIHLKMKDFIIDDLLQKIDEYEVILGITHDVPSLLPAYCGTGKEQ